MKNFTKKNPINGNFVKSVALVIPIIGFANDVNVFLEKFPVPFTTFLQFFISSAPTIFFMLSSLKTTR